jgi:serine/threonine-protein kinase
VSFDRKLCVVCSRIYRSGEATCPDDGSPLVIEAEGGPRAGRLGHVIGNYRLLRVLGEGGVGTVYEAEHVRLGRKVAVKVLHPDVVTRELVLRFFNEARAVNSIRHPNIIDVEDFVTTPTGEHYMVMELLVGEDLRSVISRDKKLDPDRVAAIGGDVASALAAVHEVGIIHRDLKPDNVFLIKRDGREQAKLLDFGIAKFVDDKQGVTRAGMTMGTPAYMAPEQILQGQEIGLSSDLYALGMVMYEALTGAPAFSGATNAAIMRAQCVEPVTPPSQRRKEPLPPVLEAVVMKCLEKDTANRFASAYQVVEALRADRPVPLSRKVERELARAGSRRRIAYMMPALAMAAAAAVLHFWADLQQLIDPQPAPGTAAAGTVPVAAAPVEPAPVPEPPPAPVTDQAPAPPVAPSTMALDLRSEPPGAALFAGVERAALGVAPVVVEIPRGTEPIEVIARFPDGTEVTETLVPDRAGATIAFTKPAPPVAAPVRGKRGKGGKGGTGGKKRGPSTNVDRDGTMDPFK